MPIIRVLRNGQLTLPAQFRKVLEIQQGDLLDVGLEEDKIILRPVTTVERRRVRERFFELVDKTWKKNKDTDPKEVQRIVNQVVEEVRKEETAIGTEK